MSKEFGERPVLVNIVSGAVALYKRGKVALRDLREGNVKKMVIKSRFLVLRNFFYCIIMYSDIK